jgi:hypothetical protein
MLNIAILKLIKNLWLENFLKYMVPIFLTPRKGI